MAKATVGLPAKDVEKWTRLARSDQLRSSARTFDLGRQYARSCRAGGISQGLTSCAEGLRVPEVPEGLPSQHVADAAGVVRLSGQREMSDRGQPASPRGGAVVVSSKRADDVEDAGLLIDHDICRQHFKRRAAWPLEGARPSVELNDGVGALRKGAAATAMATAL